MTSLAERGAISSASRGASEAPYRFRAEIPEHIRKDSYLANIDREDLSSVITPSTPVAIFSMENYRHDMPAQGGLGMVVGDWSYIYRKLGVPVAIFSPFYNQELHQRLENYYQVEDAAEIDPAARGFTPLNNVAVRLRSSWHPEGFDVPIYEKQEDNVHLVAPYHHDIKDVYNGPTNGDHRLFQEVVEGFGGHQAMVQLGYEPPLYLLNEAPVVFASIAEVDRLRSLGMPLPEALQAVRNKTVYVNHTLIQAVEEPFEWHQFEDQVFPNIENGDVKSWVGSMFEYGQVKLSTIALELSGKKRGVSMLHSREASKVFVDRFGQLVNFENNTNGISLERWAHPDLYKIYTEAGIIDEHENFPQDFQEKIDSLDPVRLKEAKDAAKDDFRVALKDMRDQNGNIVELPEGAKVVGWARRMAGYKRPMLPFSRPDELARILEENNAHFFVSGKAHSRDNPMKGTIQDIVRIIESHPVLSERVHYIQDYSEKVSAPLIRAADVWLNNPKVREWENGGKPTSTEADGTSHEKASLNLVLNVSTEDGGFKDEAITEVETGKSIVPDDQAPYFFKIEGESPEEEIDSMYKQLNLALKTVDGQGPMSWEQAVKRRLKTRLPIISGARWVRDELNIGLPRRAGSEMAENTSYALPN
jgi:starch phosphorylase